MPLNATEMTHEMAIGLDTREPQAIARILADAQAAAAAAVTEACGAIAEAARLAAGCITGGGRLVYAGAGSSGLMALADALELPGTFGISRERIAILFAGAPGAFADMKGGSEDDVELARRDVARESVGAGDCLIGVSASGSTPYTLAALEAAKARGAATVALANNRHAPMLAVADAPIFLPTPPEVVAGSTRMGAGTAQKIALNVFSTVMAARLGHIHDGMMVNVAADNTKLKGRAARIVASVAHADEAAAAGWLEQAGGSVKHAILLAAGAADLAAAERLLASSGMRLRPALEILGDGHASGDHGR